MSPFNTVRTAFIALAANTMRSSLTMLGIIIGVSAVISDTPNAQPPEPNGERAS